MLVFTQGEMNRGCKMNDIIVIANTVLPFVIMAGIFYFMLWRPQKQEQKKRKAMLDSLKKGDKIITIGGMYGTLTKVGPQKVTVKLAEGVEIEFSRTAISTFQDADKVAEVEKGIG